MTYSIYLLADDGSVEHILTTEDFSQFLATGDLLAMTHGPERVLWDSTDPDVFNLI